MSKKKLLDAVHASRTEDTNDSSKSSSSQYGAIWNRVNFRSIYFLEKSPRLLNIILFPLNFQSINQTFRDALWPYLNHTMTVLSCGWNKDLQFTDKADKMFCTKNWALIINQILATVNVNVFKNKYEQYIRSTMVTGIYSQT